MSDYRMHATASAAAAKIEGQGLAFPSAPESDVPELPLDITELDESELMVLFTEFTAWSDFAGAQHAMAVVDERDSELGLDLIEAETMVREWKGGTADRVAIAKAKTSCDEEVVKARKIHRDRYAYRKLIENLATNLERDAALVSRELTRRTSGPQPTVAGRRSSRWTP